MIAAFVPIDVPAIIRVIGIIATIRIIKGIDRIIFTINDNGLLQNEHERIFPFSVTTSNIPKGMPITADKREETNNMYKVSANDLNKRLIIIGDIP